MGRSPARQSSRRTEQGSNTPVSGEISYRRPTGANADGLPTVRNSIPWRDMERKLAVRLAARAAAGELTGEPGDLRVPREVGSSDPPANSGVRPSLINEDVGDLSFKVYTLADLDARRDEPAPVSAAPIAAPRPSLVGDLMAGRWPNEWQKRKSLIVSCLAMGALVVFALAALLVAELTDDMKTKRTATAAQLPPAADIEEPVPVVSPPAPPRAAPEPAVTLELDDLASPPARAGAAGRSPKRMPVKKKGR